MQISFLQKIDVNNGLYPHPSFLTKQTQTLIKNFSPAKMAPGMNFTRGTEYWVLQSTSHWCSSDATIDAHRDMCLIMTSLLTLYGQSNIDNCQHNHKIELVFGVFYERHHVETPMKDMFNHFCLLPIIFTFLNESLIILNEILLISIWLLVTYINLKMKPYSIICNTFGQFHFQSYITFSFDQNKNHRAMAGIANEGDQCSENLFIT